MLLAVMTSVSAVVGPGTLNTASVVEHAVASLGDGDVVENGAENGSASMGPWRLTRVHSFGCLGYGNY